MWQFEPKNIHRWRGLRQHQSSPLAHRRKSPIGPDDKRCFHLVHTISAHVTHAAYGSVLFDQRLDLRTEPQIEFVVLAGLTGEKIQKLRLRNEHDEGELGLQSPEIEGI